jgi:homoserine kinase type II
MDHPFVPRLAEEVRNLRADLPKGLPTGIIHGDLFADNVIAQGDEIRAVLDFEEIALEVFVLDIAMAFVGCGWEDALPVRARWDALLAGYQRVRPLSTAERQALPIYLRYATVGIATWRFHQFNVKRPEANQQHRYLEMIHRLDGPRGLF